MNFASLADVVLEARPGFASGKSDEDGYVQVRMNNVSLNGELSFGAIRRVPKTDTNLTRFAVRPGDVLFNATNSPEQVGKSALFTGHCEPVVYSNHFLRLRFDLGKVHPAYVARWLQAKRAAGVFTGMCKQWVNQAAVESQRLLALELPLPSLPEQRRIAAILDEADALRAKRRAALAQLDEMAQAIFVEMSASADSNIWPSVKIADLTASMRTGPFGSQLLHSEFVDSGVAVLGIDNAVTNEFSWKERRYITQEKFDQLSRFRVFAGDLIITIMGTCGRAAVVPENIPVAITTKHLCSITLDSELCLPDYLHACFLRHPSVLKQLGVSARGAVMPGLNMGLIRDTVVPLPPMPVQVAFSQRMKRLKAVRHEMEAAAQTLDVLFASLQHRAFTGAL